MTEVVDRMGRTNTGTSSHGLRPAGIVALLGAVTMVIGAALYATGGADPWLAVSSGDMATYLADAAQSSTTLYAGLAFWIAGATTMAVGGGLLAGATSGPASMAARTTYTVGAAVAIPAFVAMAALVRLASAASASFELADALAFLGTNLDDIATVLIVGISPVLVAISARGGWMPGWLAVWAWLAGVAGIVSIVAIFLGMSPTLGFIIVPVGIGWLIASGIVAIRHG